MAVLSVLAVALAISGGAYARAVETPITTGLPLPSGFPTSIPTDYTPPATRITEGLPLPSGFPTSIPPDYTPPANWQGVIPYRAPHPEEVQHEAQAEETPITTGLPLPSGFPTSIPTDYTPPTLSTRITEGLPLPSGFPTSIPTDYTPPATAVPTEFPHHGLGGHHTPTGKPRSTFQTFTRPTPGPLPTPERQG